MEHKFSVVEIVWEDATTHYGQQDINLLPGLTQVKSIGYFLSESPGVVWLAGAFHDADPADITVIPKSQIVSRTVIRE